MEEVCKQIIKQWTEYCNQSAAKRNADDGIYVTLVNLHALCCCCCCFSQDTPLIKIKIKVLL